MTLPIGLSAPPAFPTAELDDLHAVMTERLPQGPLLEQYGAAVNAVCLRYLSLVDDDREFVSLITTYGESPRPRARYRQERTLFAFYANAFSLFESFGYLAHHVGAAIDRAAFSLDPARQSRVSFSTTADRYGRSFPKEAISRRLLRVASGKRYTEVKDVRNALSHRTAPGRRLYRSVGTVRPNPPTVWKLSIHGMRDMVLAPATTADRLYWIDSVLPNLMRELQQFAEVRVPVAT